MHKAERRGGGGARHHRTRADAISSRGSQKFRASHFYAAPSCPPLPRPLPAFSPSRFIFCHSIFSRRQYVDLRVSQRARDSRACIDDDECIALCTLRTHTGKHTDTWTRARASTSATSHSRGDRPCLDNAITSLNFLSLCLTSVTGGPGKLDSRNNKIYFSARALRTATLFPRT